MNDDVLMNGEFLPHRVAVARLRENGISEGCAVAFASTLPCRASFASKKGQWVPWVRKKWAKKGQACWVLLGPDGRPTKYRDEKPPGADGGGADSPSVTDEGKVAAGIKADPGDATAHHAMADILAERGDHEKSDQFRHQALTLEATSWKPGHKPDGPEAQARASAVSRMKPGGREHALRGVLKDAYEESRQFREGQDGFVRVVEMYRLAKEKVPNLTPKEFRSAIVSHSKKRGSHDGELELHGGGTIADLADRKSQYHDEHGVSPRGPSGDPKTYVYWPSP
jgi:hypothetical protein